MIKSIEHVFELAIKNWVEGGWCMPIMALDSLIMFALALHVYLQLREQGIKHVPEPVWRQWLEKPNQRKGPVGRVIDHVTTGHSEEQVGRLFTEIRSVAVAPLERDLRIMGICASAAPLVGLLGTVTGMLALFAALSRGTGGDETMKMIAKGVSEALLATQTGLVVALPGMIIHHTLVRKLDRVKSFLARLETAVMQKNVYLRGMPEKFHDPRRKEVSRYRRFFSQATRNTTDFMATAGNGTPRTLENQI